MKYGSELSSQQTPIPGLLLFDLPVHGDSRGWFKENWQREKMLAHGLPDFGPVQNNVSFNSHRGTTRGIHAEPWDKFISVATGSVFAAWVDLREGASFGTVFTTTLDPSKSLFLVVSQTPFRHSRMERYTPTSSMIIGAQTRKACIPL